MLVVRAWERAGYKMIPELRIRTSGIVVFQTGPFHYLGTNLSFILLSHSAELPSFHVISEYCPSQEPPTLRGRSPQRQGYNYITRLPSTSYDVVGVEDRASIAVTTLITFFHDKVPIQWYFIPEFEVRSRSSFNP